MAQALDNRMLVWCSRTCKRRDVRVWPRDWMRSSFTATSGPPPLPGLPPWDANIEVAHSTFMLTKESCT